MVGYPQVSYPASLDVSKWHPRDRANLESVKGYSLTLTDREDGKSITVSWPQHVLSDVERAATLADLEVEDAIHRLKQGEIIATCGFLYQLVAL